MYSSIPTDYATQSSDLSPGWQTYADFDTGLRYDASHFHDQQYYPTSDMNFPPNQPRSQGHGEGWPPYT